ncbi:hypothetical protein BBO_05766 [Beauveria brongniartii RCEF 3172]|uniref:Myb-like domain-containing protein n=1 Tax=Beauveria brongniartii RCEF 3172 TaxID=1081107 RepID=A0A167CIB0_9HYPO|nr:hypothetical protein BBO_05766 [Beauveria brongniartii RCEF 3172]
MTNMAAEAKSAWTEEARYQFLLRIIGQLQRNGQSIKWDEINIPGRTQKSLQHQWAKIRTQVADLEKSAGQTSVPSTPTKAKALPSNSPTSKKEFDEDD